MTETATQEMVTVEVGSPTSRSSVSRDLAAAKDAYKLGDTDASKAAHDGVGTTLLGAATEQHGGTGSEYIKSIVFGGLDGIITTFAIISASAGAGFGTDVILLMGFANLIADGISMGFGDFLSSQAELDYALNERKREEWEVDNYLEGEKTEMVELYVAKGMTKEEATTVIDVFARHKQMFVDLMMVEELGLEVPDAEAQPWKEGLVTFTAFLIFGSVPLWMYVIFKLADPAGTLSADLMFGLTCVATAVTMFLLGVFKAGITKQNRFKSGGFMLMNGSIAAASAYFVGWLFEEALGVQMTDCSN